MPIQKLHNVNEDLAVTSAEIEKRLESDNESDSSENNNYDELLTSLSMIKFKIKLIKDLRKVGVCTRKEALDMTKKYNDMYLRQLKIFCDSNELKNDIELSECNIKLQELQHDFKQIKKHGKSLFKLIKLN